MLEDRHHLEDRRRIRVGLELLVDECRDGRCDQRLDLEPHLAAARRAGQGDGPLQPRVLVHLRDQAPLVEVHHLLHLEVLLDHQAPELACVTCEAA